MPRITQLYPTALPGAARLPFVPKGVDRPAEVLATAVPLTRVDVTAEPVTLVRVTAEVLTDVDVTAEALD